MKILLKEKLAELAATMESANQYFRGLADKGGAGDLCALCQTSAQKMGGIIEEVQGEAAPTVALLEEYCELIYELYTGEPNLRAELLKKLEVQVSRIQDSIRRDIPTEKMKAVFMPYNASMWDSLGSVYAKAKEDPRFDVKVIPIPYYSLGPDGKPLEACYEGREMEKYVPITDYKKYNLAKERPDIIFIHNPYDNCNLVTRVFDAYFSSNLVKYTQHLVYIPYYVSRNKTLPHFAQMPGVKNAWRSFVQNETIRQQYIDGGIAPEKVVALGSPKLDMVAQLSQTEMNIPPEWSILKGKQVFFYNTAIVDILNNRDCFLDKVRYTIDTVQKHPDMALLWRPHPLSMSTLQSMAPELLEGYRKIVEDFQCGGLGVYDESGDLERAIAISDGYIGDSESSVSSLYEATGKPTFYVEYYDPDFMQEPRWARALCGEVIDQKLYLFSWEYNAIITYDEQTKAVVMEKGNEAAVEHEPLLYLQSIAIGDTIYFTSGASSTVLKYRVTDGSKSLIELGEGDNRDDCVFYKGKLYFFPIYYADQIKILDLKTERVSTVETGYTQQFPKLDRTAESPLFVGDVVVGNVVWRPCYLSPFVQIFDLERRQLSYIVINGLQEPLRALAYDGNYFWCAAMYKNKIYKWDWKNNRIVRTITVEGLHETQNGMLFAHIYYFKGSMWVFLREEYRTLRIDVKTEKMEWLVFSGLFKTTRRNPGKVLFSERIKTAADTIYMFPYYANGVIKIDTQTNSVTLEQIPVEQLPKGITGNVLNEGMCDLETFLRWSQHKRDVQGVTGGTTSGEKIWRNIIEQLYL